MAGDRLEWEDMLVTVAQWARKYITYIRSLAVRYAVVTCEMKSF